MCEQAVRHERPHCPCPRYRYLARTQRRTVAFRRSTAAAKEIHLKQLKSAGARQFCEIWPRNLRVTRMKRIDAKWSWLGLRLIGDDERRYAITIYKTDGLDPSTLSLIQSQFPDS